MNLRKYQKQIKKTREETACEIGIKKSTLDSYLDGKAVPSIENLIKLSNYYNVSTDELLGISNNTQQLPILTAEQKKLMQMIIALNRDNFGIAYGVIMGIYQKQMLQSN